MQLSVPDFANARVLVVGDVMLDRYWHGSTSRVSPEAPVPVVNVGEEEERAGGAANVALNVAALGARPVLLAVTGEDAAADRLEASLEEAQIDCRFLRVPGIPTITKLRVLSRHQQLIRLDFEQRLEGFDAAAFHAAFEAALPEVDVVVLSDYAKGTLAEAPAMIERARRLGVPVVVDPKGRDFDIYAGATVITPNLVEFEGVVGSCGDELVLEARGRDMGRRLFLDAVLITRGEHGMSLVETDGDTSHLAAMAREVYDVTGAGDTVVAVLGAALAAGAPLERAAGIANVAAGVVVGKLGTATVTAAELRRAISGHTSGGRGVVTEAELLQLVHDARAQGERVVMTNGCFDILHAGHVAYLEQARSRGDRLIVAVNDDHSVRRLKGASRPVNTLEQRMAVVSALAAVDWVVPFSEDTPERLICDLRPHVLVKGGDYQVDEIAGSQCVRNAGGEVVILDYVAGCSTTALINRIAGDGDQDTD